MAVLVTGGTGFLGQWLVQALLARRLEVKALVRPGSDTSAFQAEHIEPVVGDISDSAVVSAAMRDCDLVIHAAARPEGPGRRAEFERVNVDGFRHVMDAAWNHGVRHVVHVSSFLALGPSYGEVRNEDHMRGERRHPTEHERTKTIAEGLTRSYVSGGLPLTVVYPTLLFGPGDLQNRNIVSQLLIDRAMGRLNSLPFDNGNRLCLAYVDDVAEGVVRALERGETGARYILGGENRTIYDMLRIFAAVGGLRGTANLSTFLGNGKPSRLKAWGARLARRTTPSTRRVLDFMQEDWAFSSARAAEELGYRIRPLSDGLKRTVEDLRERGLLPGAVAAT
jgi:farnesol dehydrogenase